MKKSYQFGKKRSSRVAIWLLAFVAVITIGAVGAFHHSYTNNLRPVSSSQQTVFFTVSFGDTKHQIAMNLKNAGLIRNTRAFEIYVRGSEFQNLQAGTYTLSPSMSAQKIVKKIATGDVTKNLITILPGKRLDQIKKVFTDNGYSASDVDQAFNPATYAGHPALASLPASASLEGYLYPDSFQKEIGTPATKIIRESLDEMQKKLTSDVIAGFSAQGLDTYKGITLASIVAQESSVPADQAVIAQVFLLRLKQGMALGSDPTAAYASAIAGQPLSFKIDSPYNTRVSVGLPPGPIGNVTQNSLQAVAHPSNTSYLYFLSGDDDKLYPSYTEQQHETMIEQHCQKKCS